MKEKKWITEVILYLCFWALYAPVALGMWYYENGSLVKLSIILLIGLGIILAYLLLLQPLIFRKKKSLAAEEEILPEQTDAQIFAFENVFKPNFGKIETDLD